MLSGDCLRKRAGASIGDEEFIDHISKACHSLVTPMPYGILLVDDHRILRDGIKAILELTPEFRVVAETGNGSSAVTLCGKLEPDVVLMDLQLPGINGIEATTEIVRRYARTKVIILTMNDDENSVVAAFRSGVQGFLLKKASSADLLDALRTVSKGGCYLSAEVSNHLLNRIQRGDLDLKEVPDPIAILSPREQQVLRLIASGTTTKDIANLLDLRLETVRTYRKTLMKKIGVTNVAGLTQVAFAAGLTSFGTLGQSIDPGVRTETGAFPNGRLRVPLPPRSTNRDTPGHRRFDTRIQFATMLAAQPGSTR
jgi:two-component system, NarL family, response regulator DegU